MKTIQQKPFIAGILPTPVIVTTNQRKNKIKVKIVYDYDMQLWRINTK